MQRQTEAILAFPKIESSSEKKKTCCTHERSENALVLFLVETISLVGSGEFTGENEYSITCHYNKTQLRILDILIFAYFKCLFIKKMAN